MPLKPSGQTPTSSPPAQHPLGVLVAGQRGAALAGQLADDRHLEDQVGAERAQVAAGVVVDRRPSSSARRAGWCRSGWRPPARRPRRGCSRCRGPRPGTTSAAIGRSSGQQEPLGELGVEAELVDLVVAGQPAAQEGQELGEPRLPLVAEDLRGGAAGSAASQSPTGMPPAGRGRRRRRRRGGSAPAAAASVAGGAGSVGAAGVGSAALGAASAGRGGRARRGLRAGSRGGRRPGCARPTDGLALPVPRPGRPRVPIGMTSASPTALAASEVSAPTSGRSTPRPARRPSEPGATERREVGERLARWCTRARSRAPRASGWCRRPGRR